MSSKKRRIKRKIELMVRMDQTRMRMFPTRRAPFAWACMQPLGRWLSRHGYKARAIAALNAAGTDLPD